MRLNRKRARGTEEIANEDRRMFEVKPPPCGDDLVVELVDVKDARGHSTGTAI
jgi:hypothetical protein